MATLTPEEANAKLDAAVAAAENILELVRSSGRPIIFGVHRGPGPGDVDAYLDWHGCAYHLSPDDFATWAPISTITPGPGVRPEFLTKVYGDKVFGILPEGEGHQLVPGD